MSTKTMETFKVCHAILVDANLYTFLFQIDQELATEARAAGCSCGGVLHSARYPRKPRGAPRGLGSHYEKRLSFCCAEEDCRRRTTPSSVRFLGRRVYLGAIVVLVSAMEGGVTLKRAERLRELLGVSLRTLKRWRKWWRDTFVRSPFWKHAQGYFMPAVEETALPASALERFVGEDLQARLIGFLTRLAPRDNAPPEHDIRCPLLTRRNPQKMHLAHRRF